MFERIEIDPRVCGEKPVIKGTRIPVAVVLEQLDAGESWGAVLAGYPEISASPQVLVGAGRGGSSWKSPSVRNGIAISGAAL